jgi:hypothetical protein
MTGEGCLTVLVRRDADDSMLPWKTSPTQADGKGTLIASAISSSISRRATYPFPADLATTTASFVLDLGCLAAGSYQVTAFLDDDGNASPTDTSSSDPLDACGQPHVVTTPILAGRGTVQDFPLSVACN